MNECERQRQQLQEHLRLAENAQTETREGFSAIRSRLAADLGDWHRAMSEDTETARTVIGSLLAERLVMRPKRDKDGQCYEFEGVGTIEPVVGLVAHKVASPGGHVSEPGASRAGW